MRTITTVQVTDSLTDALGAPTPPAAREWPTWQSRADRAAQAKKMFTDDTADHRLHVVRDDGLYRHLQFHRPGDHFYWFDLITWPGVLTINGDMGAFVFSRVEDMFTFFRAADADAVATINPDYWSQKLVAHDGFKRYEADRFRELVIGEVENYFDDATSEAERVSLRNAVIDEVLTCHDSEVEARAALESFCHGRFEFYDTWELDLTDYTVQFLWSLHAIRWGIAVYDTQTAAQQPAAS